MSTLTENLRQLPLTNTDAGLHLSTSAVSQHPSTAAVGPRPSTTAAVGLRPSMVGDVEPLSPVAGETQSTGACASTLLLQQPMCIIS